MIRVTGKEWVTSDADKWGIAAEVVETMQNALAVLQFPLATASSAIPEVVPTSQDFAVSFAAELPELAGEVAPVDPAVIALDPSVALVAPIILVPGLLPVGLRGTEPANAAPQDLAIPVDSVVQGAGQLPVPAPAIPMLAKADVSDAVESAAETSRVDFVPDRSADALAASAASSMDVAARSEPRPVIGPVEGPPTKVLQAEQPAQQMPERLAADEPAAAGAMQIPPPAEVVLKRAGTVVSAAAEVITPVEDVRPPAPASITPQPTERQVDASPVSHSVSHFAKATRPILTGSSTDETIPTDLPAVESTPTYSPEDPKTAGRPILEAAVLPALSAAPPSPLPLPSPDTPVTTSFWERFFTEGSDALPKSEPPQDQVIQPAVDRIASTVGLANRLVLGTADPANERVPTDDVQESPEAEEGVEIIFTAPQPSAGPGPLPIPVFRSAPDPVLTVLPWSDEASDQIKGIESALTGLPVLSSVSTSTGTPGPGTPLTLPVQQVAAQMAGVLVQASDRATELALAPEELGKVRLRIETDAANPDRLTILINVERPETLDLFRRHAGELAEALRNSGYAGAQIDFGSHGQGSGGDQPQGRPTAGPDLPTDDVAPTQYSPRRIAGATLDLRL